MPEADSASSSARASLVGPHHQSMAGFRSKSRLLSGPSRRMRSRIASTASACRLRTPDRYSELMSQPTRYQGSSAVGSRLRPLL